MSGRRLLPASSPGSRTRPGPRGSPGPGPGPDASSPTSTAAKPRPKGGGGAPRAPASQLRELTDSCARGLTSLTGAPSRAPPPEGGSRRGQHRSGGGANQFPAAAAPWCWRTSYLGQRGAGRRRQRVRRHPVVLISVNRGKLLAYEQGRLQVIRLVRPRSKSFQSVQV
jgi:hypothetical protein